MSIFGLFPVPRLDQIGTGVLDMFFLPYTTSNAIFVITFTFRCSFGFLTFGLNLPTVFTTYGTSCIIFY